MKLKTSLPDGCHAVPARYKNSSATTNVEVVVVDGHTVVDHVVGAALLDHDKDKGFDRFSYADDTQPEAGPSTVTTVPNSEPVVVEAEPEVVVPEAEAEVETEVEAKVEAETETEPETEVKGKGKSGK